MKKNIWIIAPLAALAAVAIAPSHVFAGAAPAAQSVVDKTIRGTKVVAVKTKDGLSKTGEVMTDSWITTRVHERFVTEDLLKGSDVSVDTDDHVVTLKGTATSRAGRAKAGTIALRTEGVRRVVNHVTIGPKHKD